MYLYNKSKIGEQSLFNATDDYVACLIVLLYTGFICYKTKKIFSIACAFTFCADCDGQRDTVPQTET